MSNQQSNKQSLRAQRILANCKKIWGADKDFDIEMDCDGGAYQDCMCMVREDRGHSYGPPLTMTNVCTSPERAYDELDRMLRLWARQVESGRPMTREEALDIFSGPSGEYRWTLGKFMDQVAQPDQKTAPSPEIEKLLKNLDGLFGDDTDARQVTDRLEDNA